VAEKVIRWRTDEKIKKQMKRRGWNDNLVDDTINSPYRRVKTRDTRYRADSSGQRHDDPATAYICVDGSYVVRNDITGDVVQVSDRNDPDWQSPF
jgi:hypothetical protein